MWTMTPDGFLSAVAHRSKPGYLMVRARNKKDIDALAALIPGSKPYSSKNSDYLWRLVCSKDEYKAAVAAMIDAIDYGNFKTAVGKKSQMHASAYHKVWSDLLAISPTGHTNYGGGYGGGLFLSEEPIARDLAAKGKTPAQIAKQLGHGATTRMVSKYLASLDKSKKAKAKPKAKNRKAGEKTLPGVK